MQVPIRTLVVNQVLQPNLKDKYLATRRADQQRSMERLRADSELGQLQVIEAPLFDLEVRWQAPATPAAAGRGAAGSWLLTCRAGR
jgi:hypothetical protein